MTTNTNLTMMTTVRHVLIGFLTRGGSPLRRAVRSTGLVLGLAILEWLLVRWMGERNVFTQLLSPAPGASATVNLVGAVLAVVTRFFTVVIGPPLLAYRWVMVLLSPSFGRKALHTSSHTLEA